MDVTSSVDCNNSDTSTVGLVDPNVQCNADDGREDSTGNVRPANIISPLELTCASNQSKIVDCFMDTSTVRLANMDDECKVHGCPEFGPKEFSARTFGPVRIFGDFSIRTESLT